MRPLSLLLLLAACTSTPEPMEDPELMPDEDPALSSGRLLEHLESLQAIADANGGNRAIDTSGYMASVEWAEAIFEGLGMTVTRELFEVLDFALDSATLFIGGERLTFDRDFLVLTGSGSGQLVGTVEAVDLQLPPAAEDNSSTSGCEPEDFDSFTAGAIALLQRGSCTFDSKVRNAEAAGAVAVLIFNEGQPGRRGAFGGNLDVSDPPEIPVLSLSFVEGESLAAEGGEVDIDVQTLVERTPSYNVIADLPGISDQYWLLGAHLDSVPAGPGINDNGTGVSLVLQLAERYAGTVPDHGLRFALWGGEEVGLVGSLSHARGLDEDAVAELIGNLNFDMVGSPNPGNFIFDGNGDELEPTIDLHPASATIERLFQEHFDAEQIPHAPIAFEGRTDYVGFARAGLPVGGTFTGAEAVRSEAAAEFWGGGKAGEAYDPCYHRSCDSVDNVDHETHEAHAIAAASVLQTLLDSPDGLAARQAPRQAISFADLPLRESGGCAGHDHDALPTR